MRTSYRRHIRRRQAQRRLCLFRLRPVERRVIAFHTDPEGSVRFAASAQRKQHHDHKDHNKKFFFIFSLSK
jgi:hypothetical protein